MCGEQKVQSRGIVEWGCTSGRDWLYLFQKASISRIIPADGMFVMEKKEMKMDHLGEFETRPMTEMDLPAMEKIARSNGQYYEHCHTEYDREVLRSDLHLIPDGCRMEQKNYIGIFLDGRMAAMMDFIDHYPSDPCVYIGFFMVDGTLSAQGMGTKIISFFCAEMKNRGFQQIRLAYEMENPQASSFWKKNSFQKIGERDHPYGHMAIARRIL